MTNNNGNLKGLSLPMHNDIRNDRLPSQLIDGSQEILSSDIDEELNSYIVNHDDQDLDPFLFPHSSNHEGFEEAVFLDDDRIKCSSIRGIYQDDNEQHHEIKPPPPPTSLLHDVSLLPTPPPSPTGLVALTTAQRRIAAGSTASSSHDTDINPTETTESAITEKTFGKFSNYAWICAERRKRLLMHTMTVMNLVGRLLIWTSFIALVAGIIWYSLELKNNGTEQHLIAWFSAGAFVILGFPISIYGIVMHLTHYYRPNIQCYIVRILWMVPIYSIGSWLCLRFNHVAIYIETIRDCYESYVLYSFFQFLINVLGGERELVLLLKEKSPTRGAHMWGMQWCTKPWIMGQPLVDKNNNNKVVWTSPFYVKCKFGVLQYVILKNSTAWLTMLLEFNGLYKEGDFSLTSGYFYITFVINWSQCWALYCLILFYYALKNELAPISPVGKFLAVKSLIFFTWWQSLGIAVLSTLGMIPSYQTKDGNVVYDEEDVAKIIQYYLICLEMFGSAILHYFVFPHTEWADNPAQQVAAHTYTGRGQRLGRYRKQRAAAKFELLRLRQQNADEEEIERVALLGSLPSGNSSTIADIDADARSRCATGSSTISDFSTQMVVDDKNDASLGYAAAGPSSPNPHAQENPNSPQFDPTQTTERLGGEASGDEMSFASGSTNTTEVTGNHLPVLSSTQQPIRQQHVPRPTGFVRALIESTVPMDVVEDSANIVKGHYVVKKQTLLHHASASDEYALFVPGTKGFVPRPRGLSPRVGDSVSLPQRRSSTTDNKGLQQPTLGTSNTNNSNVESSINIPTYGRRKKAKNSPTNSVVALTPEEQRKMKQKKKLEDELAALNYSGGAVSFAPRNQR